MQFTEEKLAKLQSISETISGKEYSGTAELCRLARLGLAAEQVGRETLAKHGEDVPVTANEQRRMDSFVLHPAWRK